MKNQKFGNWVYLIVAVMTIVSLVMYVMNVNTPYYQDMNISVVVMLVVALAATAVALVLPQNTVVNKVIVDLARVLAAGMIILAGATFIGMRVESFGYIYGSNLELGNDAAFTAGNQAIWGIILFVVTWLVAVIAAFLSNKKKA